MTKYELKRELNNIGSNYFDSNSMAFFGDTMANYGVKSDLIYIKSLNEKEVLISVWVLYRKSPVNHSLKGSAYFRKDNFKRVFKAGEKNV